MAKDFDIKDINLADEGYKKIVWAKRRMPVVESITERFSKERPLSGLRVGACLHVTSETANLMIALKEGGAEVYLCASNPLSTQDEVAASLVRDFDIPVFAIHGEDREKYYEHIHRVLSKSPDITIDDGADLVTTLHTDERYSTSNVLGGTEETTTGVIRLRAMEKNGVLRYPIIAVNDAMTKHLFDNRYGTGQSTIDGILRATNILIAGKVFVVCGYGWCGKGLAMRARGMGANVVVVEIDPIKALEAAMDGFSVLSMMEASKVGDIFVTVTGNISVIRKEHFDVMKDGAILANAGHFDVEIDIDTLESISIEKKELRPNVISYILKDRREIILLSEGRLVNLSAAEGHPAEVMDMSFANQALSVEYISKNHRNLEKKVYRVPDEIDKKVASLKLESMGINIEELTEEQIKYLSDWKHGT
ncbi:MAG: adenosylhomocysteinase [Actinobacteria bacterium]|nr:adenosylhomocysteinase [Actinomycetota bacterium]